MRILPLVLILAASAADVTWGADYTIRGHVYDIETGSLVPGASITFFEQTGDRIVRQVNSDSSAAFTVVLQEGVYSVIATQTEGQKQRELRLLLNVDRDRELNLRLGDRHSPGGEFARVIFGLNQAAGTSAAATFKYFFDLTVSTPIPFRQLPDPDFGPRWRIWGDVKLASVPQQLTAKLKDYNLPTAVANLQVNELAQSVEFRGAISARIAEAPSLKLSLDKETLQKFSLHAIVGLGASTPLNPRDTLEIFKVSDDAVARFPQAKGKELIGFVGPDRDRFYRQAFAGVEVRTHYFDKTTEVALDRFPATFSITYGIDEAVTRGYIRGGVFRADGFYPLPSKWGSQFYFFFTGIMKPTRARMADPLLLVADPGKTLADLTGSGVIVTVPPTDRDYYRIGLGMDIVRLIQNIQNPTGEKRPESK